SSCRSPPSSAATSAGEEIETPSSLRSSASRPCSSVEAAAAGAPDFACTPASAIRGGPATTGAGAATGAGGASSTAAAGGGGAGFFFGFASAPAQASATARQSAIRNEEVEVIGSSTERELRCSRGR